MTPIAQRIAIAEALGWEIPAEVYEKRIIAGESPRKASGAPPLFGKKPGTENDWSKDVPDFCNDLNAMHEAEKVLTDERGKDSFVRHLLDCIWRPERKHIDPPKGGWWSITTHEAPKLISATAAQRAEAFLRTLNLWDDTK